MKSQPPDEMPTGSTDKKSGASKFTKFKNWVKNNKKRSIPLLSLGGLLVVLLIIWATPARYPALNLVSSAHTKATVLDSKSNKPVYGATVEVGGKTAQTDANGQVSLGDVDYGDTTLHITKGAYKEYSVPVTLGLGDNDFGNVSLEPTGTPVSLLIINAISKQPASGVEVAYKDSKSVSDSSGKTTLIVPPQDIQTINVETKGQGFTATVTEVSLTNPSEAQTVTALPAGNDFFFSNKSGRIDLYSSNLDGSNRQVILKGSGNETRDISLSISPDSKWIAIVSTREGKRDKNGTLLPALYVFNVSTKALTKADEGASSFTLEGWSNNKIIYTLTKDNLEYDDNHRSKAKSYDPSSRQLATLAESHGVNVYVVTSNLVIYSKTSYNKAEDEWDQKLYKISPGVDGGTKLATNFEWVDYVLQDSPTTLLVRAADKNYKDVWFKYDLGTGQFTKLSGEPADQEDRRTVTSADGKKVAWLEERDGKQTVFVADAGGGNQSKLVAKGSLQYPLRWIGNDYVIFRLASQDETADYIVALAGGEPKKITDVFKQSYDYGPYY